MKSHRIIIWFALLCIVSEFECYKLEQKIRKKRQPDLAEAALGAAALAADIIQQGAAFQNDGETSISNVQKKEEKSHI